MAYPNEANMGAVKHAVRVVSDGDFAVPVRRLTPLLAGYEHFRLDRQGQLLSPKTLMHCEDAGVSSLTVD